MYIYIDKDWFFLWNSDCEWKINWYNWIENNLNQEDLIILKNGWKYNFETWKVESTTESDARILELEKQADIENAKAYYIENRNLKLKHIMAWELSDWTPEAEAEIEKIKAEIVKDYDERQEVMKQKAIDFKNKYGEDLYAYIIFDKNI